MNDHRNIKEWAGTVNWPNWFDLAITTGQARLVSGRLNWTPSDGDDLRDNHHVWCEVLWNSEFSWNAAHAENIVVAFRTMAMELRDWPTPSEFWPRFETARRLDEMQRQRNTLRLPPPERSKEEQELINARGKQKLKDALAAVSDKHRGNIVAPIRELMEGIVNASEER